MIPSSRTSNLALTLAALTLTACGAGGLGPGDRDRRKPDGVAIDPMSLTPPPRAEASTRDGLVALRTPLGVDRAIRTIEELFRKIVLEDIDGLEAIFSRDVVAVSSTAPNMGGQSHPGVSFWQQRFRKLDYTRLAGEPLFREQESRVYRAEDSLDVAPHPSIRTELLGEGDVVVRFPVLTPRVGQDRLFGDEMILWMRREGDRYRIYRILEDFQPN